MLTPESPHEVLVINWDFVPVYAQDKNPIDQTKQKRYTYNCRADRLREKVVNKERSLFKTVVNKPSAILSDGFFEWHTTLDNTKMPYFIEIEGGYTFPVAGLMSAWKDKADPNKIHLGNTLCSTYANKMLGWIHNKPANSPDFRMPAIYYPKKSILGLMLPLGSH